MKQRCGRYNPSWKYGLLFLNIKYKNDMYAPAVLQKLATDCLIFELSK